MTISCKHCCWNKEPRINKKGERRKEERRKNKE
jgi:hypothetical protein